MPENRSIQLQIAVCDDEPTDRQQAADLTREIMAAEGISCGLASYENTEALLYCYKTFCEKKEILLPTEKGQSKLAPSDIIYVEPWDRGVRLHLTNGPIETSAKFSDLTAMLPERSFTLSHRTILVNLAFIKHLRSNEIELTDGRTLPVSKHRISDLKKHLLGYMHG